MYALHHITLTMLLEQTMSFDYCIKAVFRGLSIQCALKAQNEKKHESNDQ
jgi:hypothetical protein